MGVNSGRGRAIDRSMVKRVGRPTTWEWADLCPNVRDDGSHDPYCTSCVARGERTYIYTPHPKPIPMIWMRDRRSDTFDMTGAWEQGSCIAVHASHHPITDQDRLTPVGNPIVDRFNLTRGDTANGADLVPVAHPVEVLSIRSASASYTAGTDFALELNGDGLWTLAWQAGGAQPTVGEGYSVRMMIKPTWIVKGDAKVRAFNPGKRNQLLKTVELERYDMGVSRG